MNVQGPPLLELCGITKRYGEAVVLNDCQLSVSGGEIHALIGGNGAGKSTMMRIVAGLAKGTSGVMKLNGQPYAPSNKREAEDAGVQIVQQEFNLIPTLSVAENLLLTRLPARGGVIRRKELHERAKSALKRLGLDSISTATMVGTLGVGHQQLIEIAAALDRQCRLLILDEPTAALSTAEADTLFHRLDHLRSLGVGIIYISHRLDEIARLSDRVTALRDGTYVGTHPTADLSTDGMIELMTGERPSTPAQAVLSDKPEASRSRASGYALRVEGLSGGIVRDVSFELKRGERLGITGLVGSGRTELLRLIFGADRATSGSVYLEDDPTPHRFRHPSQAVAKGMAMVTEDRKMNGLLLSQSIRLNTTLAALQRRFSRWGLIRSQAEIETAKKYRQSMETRCTSIEQTAETLSGGNQQKVVISRWLTTAARVYLFDEPTRGIDIPARRRIYQLIESLAAEGKGVVIVSSDLEELFETCDRIAVMSSGSIVQQFERPAMSHDSIMQAAFSGYLDGSVGG